MHATTLALFLFLLSSQSFAQTVLFDTTDNIILVGDSFTNGGQREWAGHVDVSGEFLGVDTFSTAGHNLAQIRSAFTNNYNPANNYSAIVVAGGVNDVVDNRTAAQMQASVQQIIDGAQNNEHIILTTVAPFRGVLMRAEDGSNGSRFWTQARQDVADEYDAWVRLAASSSPNISVFDIRAVLDTDNDQVIDPTFTSSNDRDFLHPQNCDPGQTCGSAAIATAFLNQFGVSANRGDLNGDGVIDLLDVAPFVQAILTGVFNKAADINGDGEVDLLDVSPFVQLIIG